jgi:hypothetical protein
MLLKRRSAMEVAEVVAEKQAGTAGFQAELRIPKGVNPQESSGFLEPGGGIQALKIKGSSSGKKRVQLEVGHR